MSTSSELRRLKGLLLENRDANRWTFKWDVLRGDIVRLRPGEIESYLNDLAEKEGAEAVIGLLRSYWSAPCTPREHPDEVLSARQTALILACLEMGAAAKFREPKFVLAENIQHLLSDHLKLWM
jgi:hypothetical protein